jgi:hypothetical protein
VALMKEKLNSLPLNPNNVEGRFELIKDEVEQLNFYKDFFAVDNNDPLWSMLNEVYEIPSGRTLVDDWSEVEYLQNYRQEVNF